MAQFLKHLSNNLVVSDCREYFPRISLFQASQRGLTRNSQWRRLTENICRHRDPNWFEQAMLGFSFHRPLLNDDYWAFCALYGQVVCPCKNNKNTEALTPPHNPHNTPRLLPFTNLPLSPLSPPSPPSPRHPLTPSPPQPLTSPPFHPEMV